jgi:hypothetical protein
MMANGQLEPTVEPAARSLGSPKFALAVHWNRPTLRKNDPQTNFRILKSLPRRKERRLASSADPARAAKGRARESAPPAPAGHLSSQEPFDGRCPAPPSYPLTPIGVTR